MRTVNILGITILAGAIAIPTLVAAGTYEVDRTDDNPGATACSVAPNDCSLRGAILAANAAAGADTIHLPAGTYVLTIAGTDEEAAATGDLDVTDSLTITGADPRTTIIDGNDLDRVFDIYAPATVQLSNITVRNGNLVPVGGGIYNRGDLTITNCIVAENEAVDLFSAGGGVASEGNLSVVASTVTDNTAEGGGGIANANVGSLIVSNSTTISGNHATGEFPGITGGGILSAAPITVLDSTIAGNTSNFSGGGVEGIDAEFTNTIIAGNSPDNCDFAAVSHGHNMDDDGSCNFTGSGDQSNVADAHLAPLANYGGQTKTRALCTAAGAPDASCTGASPAIDTGADCLATDQRGVARPQGSACDIGAFEVGSPPAATIDAYACHKAKDLENPKFVATTVELGDQLGVNDGSFTLKKPFLLCNPAGVNGEGIHDLEAHLACYKVKGPTLAAANRPNVQITDQLGSIQLQATKPVLLCVPSTKTVIP